MEETKAKKTKKTKSMKKMNFAWMPLLMIVKYVLVVLAAIALIYSFLILPMDARGERIACHIEAQSVAQQITAEVAAQNQNLAEGQQPVAVNEIGLYDTQYSLCLRSKGL